MSLDGMCLEAKEVVQYTSDESSSDEDDFREDGEDSDYGVRKGKVTQFKICYPTNVIQYIHSGYRRLRKRVRYQVEHSSELKFVSTHRHVMFCLLYQQQY